MFVKESMLLCQNCGGRKTICFKRKILLKLMSIILLSCVVLLAGRVGDSLINSILVNVALALGVGLVASLVQVRCSACEGKGRVENRRIVR
jgi:hypothetical protein